jgi:uncharacterized protein (TIGR03435 family)
MNKLSAFLIVLPLLWGCYAQQTAHPEFEVASIKLIAPGQPMPSTVGGRIHGNRAEYSYMSLRQLVADAYQVLPSQVHCPDWFLTERFDVTAEMPAGSKKEDARLMLQSLLVDRFRLAVHLESREETVAALIVGQEGLKLKESPPEPMNYAPSNAERSDTSGRDKTAKTGSSTSVTMGPVGVHVSVNPGNSSVRFEASRATMTDLIRFLFNFDVSNGRPIVDRTNLKGEYEIVLDIPMPQAGTPPPSEGGASSSANGIPHPAEYASDPGNGRTLQSLKSYGLDLKRMKAPVEYLVVDHAEKMPTEN